MTEEAKPIFPLTFTKCPNCGSENRMADTVLKKQVAEGKMKKGISAFLFTHQSIIAGTPGTWLSAPMLQTYYDACLDCGTVYCFRVTLVTAMPGGKAATPPFGKN